MPLDFTCRRQLVGDYKWYNIFFKVDWNLISLNIIKYIKHLHSLVILI